ncbi:hypothetical protein DH2020_012940 [Rehmannia glutinosa]|uniref:Uncharacterized protein n=1 Tax=Rehmannia glutinosa TaxID=99300 RepID=A0ABR0X3C5_REHGL
MAITIVEKCQVQPSPGAVNEQLLPLVHFDIPWLPFHLVQNLFFYSFQCSESHFLDTIVPNLKNSLSLTLKHFPPLSGNIVFPLDSGNLPVSHYVAGDSASLTITVSSADFDNLTGNHSRDSDEFYDFVPHLPPPIYSPDSIKFSVAAVQVTLFPNLGISIGFTSHHAIGDGVTLLGFIQSWASISKFNGDTHLLALGEKCLPFYDRGIIKDANRLATECWDLMKTFRPTLSSTVSWPTYKVRATFVLSDVEIQTLKNLVLNNKPTMVHVSSFMVACAYVWTCLAKSATASGEEVMDDEPEYLSCTVDCRARLNPPLPETYFGNCLILMLAESAHERLKGNEGFLSAAQAIGETIQRTINNERGIMDGSKKRLLEGTKLIGKRVVGIAGSPRFDLYGADFGWGRPKKFEALHIDCNESISLCKPREFQGGAEIGLSMSKAKMDAFAAMFNQGLTQN